MKICHISDTHNNHNHINFRNIKADVIIHSGDFSYSREIHKNEFETYKFLEWYSSLNKFKYKILIAGNHDSFVEKIGKQSFKQICHLYDIIYLEDESITLEGFKFHGTPWSPYYGNWSFMEEDLFLYDYWTLIPDDIEILITHTPVNGICDEIEYPYGVHDGHVGSYSLLQRVKSLKNLRILLCGHIHEAYGYMDCINYKAYNGALLNYYSNKMNNPHVINLKKIGE